MIVGEQGTIMVTPMAFWLYPQGERNQLVIDQPETTIANACVSAMLDGEENLSPATQGTHVVDFMQAMYRSTAAGRLVRIEAGGMQRTR